MSTIPTPDSQSPAPAEIELTINGELHKLPYEKAFSLGCSLLQQGLPDQGIKVFEKLEPFTDRGPRAFILRAFCEAAIKDFAQCSAALSRAFESESIEVGTTLHEAFVFYHVGSRQEALKALADLANEHHELPTLCLLLGDLLEADNAPLARKCWKLAVRRDRPDGAVAAVAKQRLARDTGA